MEGFTTRATALAGRVRQPRAGRPQRPESRRDAFTEADAAFSRAALLLPGDGRRRGPAGLLLQGRRPGLRARGRARPAGVPGLRRQRHVQGLGNIRANPHVGLLFIPMGAPEERPQRLRVNGTAELSADDPLLADFPAANSSSASAHPHLPEPPALHPEDAHRGAVALRAPGGPSAAGAGVEEPPRPPRRGAAAPDLTSGYEAGQRVATASPVRIEVVAKRGGVPAPGRAWRARCRRPRRGSMARPRTPPPRRRGRCRWRCRARACRARGGPRAAARGRSTASSPRRGRRRIRRQRCRGTGVRPGGVVLLQRDVPAVLRDRVAPWSRASVNRRRATVLWRSMG